MMSAMLFHCVFQSYFDVALSVVFNAVSVQFHADLTVVSNAFRLYAYMCFSNGFSMLFDNAFTFSLNLMLFKLIRL